MAGSYLFRPPIHWGVLLSVYPQTCPACTELVEVSKAEGSRGGHLITTNRLPFTNFHRHSERSRGIYSELSLPALIVCPERNRRVEGFTWGFCFSPQSWHTDGNLSPRKRGSNRELSPHPYPPFFKTFASDPHPSSLRVRHAESPPSAGRTRQSTPLAESIIINSIHKVGICL